MSTNEHEGSVAIIGVAGRFPDAGDPETLWSNLLAGREAIRALTEDELAAVDPARRRDPRYVAVTAPVPDVERWDAAFFGLSRRDAQIADPQHRLFLECAWEGLEDAGYDPRACPGVTGVIAGCHFPTYLLNNLSGHRRLLEEVGLLQVGIANERDTLTPLVSYKLDLRGPSATVQTACSTSMVAIHLACQSLLTHESDVMLAGGAALHIPQAEGYLYEEDGLYSPDGVFRSLDARGRGRVVGNGVGVVVLKRTEDAVRDGDHIYATIIGSAMNNDGVGRAGFAAPGLRGQAELMVEALSCAGVTADDISYVEAHGTGTVLGDSVELDALSRALPRTEAADGACVVGSIKANIGHLDRASGVTGVIKTALMLRDGRIPPQVNFETPNPNLDLASFRVVSEATEWPRNGVPRRALVNSFGMGGTNAAAVLQDAPPSAPTDPPPAAAPHLLVLSARTPSALEAATARLRDHLHRRPEQDLEDVAFTLQTGRTPFNHRRTVLCADREAALAALADPSSPGVRTTTQTRHDPPLRLLVTGGAALTAAAARTLRETEPAFRAALERAGGSPEGGDAALHYALGCLLLSWGLRPRHIEGAGPYVAVAECLAGARRPEALRLDAGGAAAPPGSGGIVIELGGGGGDRDQLATLAAAAAGEPLAALHDLAGRLWLAGVPLDWKGVHGGRRRRRVPLPTYPFERTRCWIDPPPPSANDERIPLATGGSACRP